MAMAVDHSGGLWVVEKYSVSRFGGQNWEIVLCPYVETPPSRRPPGFNGIVVETNGNVWIGGTTYGELKKPWEHFGSKWVVDRQSKQRNGGPPMSPLFEFDGQRWRAFGPPNGLDVKSAVPERDEHARIIVNTPDGYYMRQGNTWEKSVAEPNMSANKRWVLRRTGPSHGELLFRENKRLVEVQPEDNQTGEVLNLRTELWPLYMADDRNNGCAWLGTRHGLYKIWRDDEVR